MRKYFEMLKNTKFGDFLKSLGFYPKEKTYISELPEDYNKILGNRELEDAFTELGMESDSYREEVVVKKGKESVLEIERRMIEMRDKRVENLWNAVAEYGNNIIRNSRYCDAGRRHLSPDGVIIRMNKSNEIHVQGWKNINSIEGYRFCGNMSASSIGFNDASVEEALVHSMKVQMFDGKHGNAYIDLMDLGELLI